MFSGIGGFDLAARWMGWETAWFSEINPYANAVLSRHWHGVPNLGDIANVEWGGVERPDIMAGGFPCQPASRAGNRKGQSDDRWLWPECNRAIRALRPRWFVGENVPGLLDVNGGRGFAEVLRDLAASGYDAEWRVLGGPAVGIPQSRPRVFLVATPARDRAWTILHQDAVNAIGHPSWVHGVSAIAADAHNKDCRAGAVPLLGDAPWPSIPHGERSGDDDRIPNRLDHARYKSIGNAIIPGIAYAIFAAIGALDA